MMDDSPRRWIIAVGALVALLALCVVTAAAGLALAQNASSRSTTATGRPGPTATTVRLTPIPIQLQPIEPVGVPLVVESSGQILVHGLVRNSGSGTGSVLLSATVFDRDGRPVGTALGSVQDVPANDTKPFTLAAVSGGGGAARAEVKIERPLPTGGVVSPLRFGDGQVRPSGAGFVMEAPVTNTGDRPIRFQAVGTLQDRSGNIVAIVRSDLLVMQGGATNTVRLTSPTPAPGYERARIQLEAIEP